MDEVTVLALVARDGDRVALSAFVRQTWGDVSRLVTAVAGRDLAEDAAQDAYLRALRALPRFRGDASARVWLLSIARRSAVDAVRAAARRRRLARLLSARVEPDAAAEICGCPVGTIRSRVARAREQLVPTMGPTASEPTASQPTPGDAPRARPSPAR